MLANGAPANAFYDARLHFYELHARQWLLIGLARAAKEHPNLVAPYADFLLKLVFDGEPHVLIRELQREHSLLWWIQDPWNPRLIYDIVSLISIHQLFLQSNRSPICGTITVGLMVKPRLALKTMKIGSILASIWPILVCSLGRCFGKSQASIERPALRVLEMITPSVGDGGRR